MTIEEASEISVWHLGWEDTYCNTEFQLNKRYDKGTGCLWNIISDTLLPTSREIKYWQLSEQDVCTDIHCTASVNSVGRFTCSLTLYLRNWMHAVEKSFIILVNCLLIHNQAFPRSYFSGYNVSSSHIILIQFTQFKKKTQTKNKQTKNLQIIIAINTLQVVLPLQVLSQCQNCFLLQTQDND
jgi:hypothetical protein